jgi:acetyl esterase/lipase
MKCRKIAFPLFIFPLVAVNVIAAPQFPDDIRVQQNVAYLPEGRTEKADLYFPKEDAAKPRPAVLIIHGGGFTSGVRDAAREINIGSTLGRNGYVCMSIDYALSKGGKAVWPQNLYDCKNAVRWLRKNAAHLNIDSDHIGVIGGSAGGHLAAMVALTGPEDKLDPPEDANISCRVQCGVDMYGTNDLLRWHDVAMLGKKRDEAPELYKRASPINYATKDDPPMLLLHGTADTTVNHEHSVWLDEALAKAGIEHELVTIEGAKHTFTLQPPQRDLRPLVVGFFDKHLKPEK